MRGHAERRSARSKRLALWALSGTLLLHLAAGLLLHTLRFGNAPQSAMQAPRVQFHIRPAGGVHAPKSVEHTEEVSAASPATQKAQTQISERIKKTTRRSSGFVLPPDISALNETDTAEPSSTIDADAEAIWESAVLAHLQRHKHYPTSARLARMEDRIQVDLSVDRSGRILSHRIRASQGFAVLNQAVNDLLLRASPVPAPPPSVSHQRLQFSVVVEFTTRRTQPPSPAQ